ncbi:MAG TPA: hypothetical protein VFE33_07760 [Thermoanaerobaculia bacterium]|nr:hypothetical protein [Thermoanaerobaculia bacterium]
MKYTPRVHHAAIAVVVLLGLFASQSAFAFSCSTICKCRAQCSTPCSDAGDTITCGVYGICECSPVVASSMARSAENPLALAAEPDPLAALLGTSCATPPAPGQAAAVGR